jgi:coiled-coil domain-containing protein 61
VTTIPPADIEEISHKAGNLKKFSVFAKMLSSSFSKDNESVFVDILTFTDLELLKARKTGAKQQPASLQAGRQYQKRYVILTYSAEFDRVHYPLPLGFEETPNVPALRRNIARLRRQLQDKSDQALLPASDKEK